MYEIELYQTATGNVKKQKQTPQFEIDTARRRMEDYIGRYS